MWRKSNRWKIIVPILAVIILAAAFLYGGGADIQSRTDASAESAETAAPATEAAPESTAPPDGTPETANPPAIMPAPPDGADGVTPSDSPEQDIVSEDTQSLDGAAASPQGETSGETADADKYLTEPVPEGQPLPVEPQDAAVSDTEYTCTLSVRCDTLLDNMDRLDRDKWELVPEDGVIFEAAEVTFYEGESVFNVLRRELKRAKIHMEFVNTPMYNSAYIEGINNLYEFDAGELSGWMYSVTPRDTGIAWFPNYGCSRYQLQDGDTVEWMYTCDLGVDIGGHNAAGG